MRRLLWLGVGLAVGALVVRKLTQKAQTYTKFSSQVPTLISRAAFRNSSSSA